MKKQIGIFSGSFNPIHMGHLMLANYMKEFTYLDEVWFVVSPHNPLKVSDELLDDELRLHMTSLALEGYPFFKLSDIEFHMPRPSYSIHTLSKLRKDNVDKDFTLIIGGDNWANFHLWKDYEQLRSEFRILVYPRLGDDIVVEERFKGNVQLVNAPIVEVSSTFIRNGIKEGKNMRAFVPPGVYDFIEEKRLYL